MSDATRPIIPCPRCGDDQRVELGGVTYEIWQCNSAAGSTSASTGVEGCGSHTHEVDR